VVNRLIKKEIWKTVIYQGERYDYQISNTGKLRRNKKILKLLLDSHGYGGFTLWKNNKSKHALLHRLIALHFLSKPKNYNVVNHKDGNIENNAISNLEWTNPRGNILHRLYQKPMSDDLTRREVIAIKFLLKEGISHIILAKAFDVSRGTIFQIQYNQTWKKINDFSSC